nr:E3 ubiquitin-protein ligase At1g12760-like [Ipomoea batatas]
MPLELGLSNPINPPDQLATRRSVPTEKIRSAEGVVDSCSSNYVINRTYENNGYAGTVGAGAPGVAEQMDERQSNWAYSKPVVILVWNFALFVLIAAAE